MKAPKILPNIPHLALTLGEPAGVGPDLCIQMAQQPLPAHVVVIGSGDLLKQRAKNLNLPLALTDFDSRLQSKPNGLGKLSIVDVPLRANVTPGELDVANSRYVLETLKRGYALCDNQDCDALVTLPIHKAIIHLSGVPFSGHTEYLAALAQVDDVLMTFYTEQIILGLVTTHCPLQAVSQQLTRRRLEKCIQLLDHGLTHIFNRPNLIRVLGLNPHAGESGTLGDEEQTVMLPVISRLQAQGYSLKGPVSGDTAFNARLRGEKDAILAMYHDQGLAPLKALYFNEIVNVTLGLPFLRTSVDHGTALDLAGTSKGSTKSLGLALNTAAQFASDSHSSSASIPQATP